MYVKSPGCVLELEHNKTWKFEIRFRFGGFDFFFTVAMSATKQFYWWKENLVPNKQGWQTNKQKIDPLILKGSMLLCDIYTYL